MKIDRLLEIVILLLNRGYVTTREMAERFQVSQRTIQRDMVSLALAGIPLYAPADKQGGYAILPEYRVGSRLVQPEDFSWVARALSSLATSYSGYPLEKLSEKFNALAGRYDALIKSDIWQIHASRMVSYAV